MFEEVPGKLDELTKQMEANEKRMEEIENEIDTKFQERLGLFRKTEQLKREKLRLLGWDV